MGRDPENLCPWNSLHNPQAPHSLYPAIVNHFDDSGEGLVNLVSFLYCLRLLSFQNLMTRCLPLVCYT